MKNELKHWGIKGQKWGFRRFQNPDGSLTPAGKERYGNSKDYAGRPTSGRESIDSGSKAAKSSSNVIRTFSKWKRDKAKNKIDVSKLSDKELKDYVTRKNLERQYKDFKTEDVSSGADKVADILAVAGDVLAIAASATVIYKFVKERQKK